MHLNNKKNFRSNINRTDIVTEMKVYFPEMMAEGLYKAEGRLNNMKIKSKGFFNISASKMKHIVFL